MLQKGIGYTLTFDDGDYDHWTDYDKAIFFQMVKEAYEKMMKIRTHAKEISTKIRRQT